MSTLFRSIVCLLLSVVAALALAAEVMGVKLADKVRLGDAGPELVLTGAGVRTRVVVNSDTRGTIPGEDFNRALLSIWLGENPADSNLKRAMLGG